MTDIPDYSRVDLSVFKGENINGEITNGQLFKALVEDPALAECAKKISLEISRDTLSLLGLGGTIEIEGYSSNFESMAPELREALKGIDFNNVIAVLPPSAHLDILYQDALEKGNTKEMFQQLVDDTYVGEPLTALQREAIAEHLLVIQQTTTELTHCMLEVQDEELANHNVSLPDVTDKSQHNR